MDVFISYETTTGRSYASNLKEALRRANISAFVADEDIPKGARWESVINKAVADCEHFVVIMTMGAIISPGQITHEIMLANQHRKHIIPCKPYTIDRMYTRTLPVVYELQQIDFDVKEDLADKILLEIMKRTSEKAAWRTETEAVATELSNIQSAVISMMVDNNLPRLPNPVVTRTNDMGAFPDASSLCGSIDKFSDPNGNAYQAGDKDGYLLYGHDITADNSTTPTVNYVTRRYTKGTYAVDASGTVTQVTTGY